MSQYVNPPEVRKLEAGWTGKFYERCVQKQLFGFGATSTALVAANATATGLTATAQPVIGLYNPANSGKNLVVLQTCVVITSVAASTVLPGSFNWVYSTNASNAVSTGTAGLNRFIGAPQPNTSAAVAFALGTALTGLSGSLTNSGIPLSIGSVVTAQTSTAANMFGSPWVEQNDGSWVIAPGCFLGVMNTVSTTTVSVAPSILWAELDVTG